MHGYYEERLAADRLKRCYDRAPQRVEQYLRAEVAFVEDRSRRTVSLPSSTTAALKEQRVAQATRRLILGAAWQGLGLVVDAGDGRPIHPDVLSRYFQRLTLRMEVGGVRLHDLRHFHATELLVRGVHPKVVSERLGHSSVAFTMDVYSHVIPAMQETAAVAMEAALGAD